MKTRPLGLALPVAGAAILLGALLWEPGGAGAAKYAAWFVRALVGTLGAFGATVGVRLLIRGDRPVDRSPRRI